MKYHERRPEFEAEEVTHENLPKLLSLIGEISSYAHDPKERNYLFDIVGRDKLVAKESDMMVRDAEGDLFVLSKLDFRNRFETVFDRYKQ